MAIAPVPLLSALADVHAWAGLRNSDDQGTQFDFMAEWLDNGEVVATATTLCVTGLTRNPSFAHDVVVPWAPFEPVPLASGDVLELRLSARIGTTQDGTKCPGPGGSHASAVGLRVYYDATAVPSRSGTTITPPGTPTPLWLRSDGSPCGDTESGGVTERRLDPVAPTGTAAKCKDSGVVRFADGNVWSVIGVWSLAPL
jgi:hypothetical protein